MKLIFLFVLSVYLLLINIAATVLVVYDKSISKLPRGSIRRIPEKTFVLFSMIGGGMGTLLTMLLIRHKTKDHKGLLARIGVFAVLWCIAIFWITK